MGKDKSKKSGSKFQAPIGFRHGLPAFHLFTGNLPVISTQFHQPNPELKSTAANDGGIDDTFAYYTGNLRPLSVDLFEDLEIKTSLELLDPMWVELPDPYKDGGHGTFWFHKRYRSRREEKPKPDDDGRRGAGKGEFDQSVPHFIELYDAPTNTLFYVDTLRMTTSWKVPKHFQRSGQPYKPHWLPVYAEEAAADDDSDPIAYMNTETGEQVDQRPEDYDGDAEALMIARAQGEPKAAPEGAECPPLPDEITAMLAHMLKGKRTYGKRRGWLRKAGGGSRLFGSTRFKRRYCIVRNGIMTYFDSEAKALKREAKKNVSIDLDNYELDIMEDSDRRFSLVPRTILTQRAHELDKESAPAPGRSFHMEADSAEDKAAWLHVLGHVDAQDLADEAGAAEEEEEEADDDDAPVDNRPPILADPADAAAAWDAAVAAAAAAPAAAAAGGGAAAALPPPSAAPSGDALPPPSLPPPSAAPSGDALPPPSLPPPGGNPPPGDGPPPSAEGASDEKPAAPAAADKPEAPADEEAEGETKEGDDGAAAAEEEDGEKEEEKKDGEEEAAAEEEAGGDASKDDDELPEGWTKVVPEGHGPSYFWNVATNDTQFNKPTPDQAVPLPEGWVKVPQDDGPPYYWNESTNATSWEFPTTAD